MNQLLIIGNGFDKYCGLASSFGDYFASIIGKTQPVKEAIRYFNNSITNFVDYYIIAQLFEGTSGVLAELTYIERLALEHNIQNLLWSNFELAIFMLASPANTGQNKIDNILNWIKKSHMYGDSIAHKYYNSIKDVPTILYLSKFYDSFSKLQECVNSCRNDRELEEMIYSNIGKDITEFENKFCAYLKNQIEDNCQYQAHAENLFNSLITNSRAVSVLSFNYTKPTIFSLHPFESVHGRLEDGSIIIGIDSTNIAHDWLAYRFTKTFRKVETFLKSPSISQPSILDKAFDEIIFLVIL